MSIAMTDAQRSDFEDKGFIIIEKFFTGEELTRLLDAVEIVADRVRKTCNLGPDDPFQVRNLLSHHEAFLDLVDHPRMLPLVVDAIGWNIQIRTTHLDYRPPYPEGLKPGDLGVANGEDQKAGYRNLGWHPDLSPQFQAASLDGRLPFMEVKVFYTLCDMRQSGCGNLWLAPGSHKRSPKELRDNGRRVDAKDAFELRLPAGAAVLWRTATWHCVGPNQSKQTRKIMHYGYHHRWLRPTDYIEQSPELIARSSPIRRQLLGAIPTGGDPLGEDSAFAPSSQHWQPKNPDDTPLRAWAEARNKPAKSAQAEIPSML